MRKNILPVFSSKVTAFSRYKCQNWNLKVTNTTTLKDRPKAALNAILKATLTVTIKPAQNVTIIAMLNNVTLNTTLNVTIHTLLMAKLKSTLKILCCRLFQKGFGCSNPKRMK